MRDEYIFRIQAAYLRTGSDDNEINTDKADNKKWGEGYKGFKSNIRRHLKIAQKGRCAFCRCYVSIGTSYSNLEHLVSKSDYPQFEFLPDNLVYCCWLCNSAKLKENTLSNPIASKNLQIFPSTSNGFTIVNPYHDNYEEHIDFLDEIIIVKKDNSSKGANTIEYYKLSRPELAEERAREFKLNQDDINNQLLQRLTMHSNEPSILKQIKDIIAQLPDWTLPNN